MTTYQSVGWKSWKLIARTISPTSSVFAAPKAIYPVPGEHGGNFEETRGGVGKSGAQKRHYISVRHKDRGKVTTKGL